jgi:hypothetical protein
MPIRHLADSDSVALLRFWSDARGDDELPEWTDASRLPVTLLPNIAVTHRQPEPVFIYVGAEALRRLGTGITGAAVYREVYGGEHSHYLRSIGDDVVKYGKPIFSAALFSVPASSEPVTVGRLYAPFRYRRSSRATVIVGLQIIEGARDLKLREAQPVEELDRRLVVYPAAVARQLERLRSTGGDTSARDAAVTEAIATLGGSALVTLGRSGWASAPRRREP